MTGTETLRDELDQLETDTFEILDVADVAQDAVSLCSTSTSSCYCSCSGSCQ